MGHPINNIFFGIGMTNPYYANVDNVIQDGKYKGKQIKDIQNALQSFFDMNVDGDIEKEAYFTENVGKIIHNPQNTHETLEKITDILSDAGTYRHENLYEEALKIGKNQRESIHNSFTALGVTPKDFSSARKESWRVLTDAKKRLEDAQNPSVSDRIAGIFSKDKREENRQAQKNYNNLKTEYNKALQNYNTAREMVAEEKKLTKDERKQRIVDNLRERYIDTSDKYDKIKSHNEKLKQTYLESFDGKGYEKLKAEWDKKAPAAFDSSKYDISTPEGQQKLQEAQAKHQELIDKHKQGFLDQIKANKENVLNADLKKYEQAAMDSFQQDIVEARRRGNTFIVTDSMKHQKMQEMIAKDFNVSMNDAGRGIDVLKSMIQEQKLLDLKNLKGSRLDAYDTSEKEVKDASGKITKEKDFKAFASRKAGSSGIEKAAQGGWKGKAAIFGGVAAAALATVGIGSMMMSGGRQSNSNLYNPYQAMY